MRTRGLLGIDLVLELGKDVDVLVRHCLGGCCGRLWLGGLLGGGLIANAFEELVDVVAGSGSLGFFGSHCHEMLFHLGRAPEGAGQLQDMDNVWLGSAATAMEEMSCLAVQTPGESGEGG